MDTSVLMGLEDKVAVWPDTSDSDVVSSILGQYGVSTDVTSTNTTHQEDVTTTVQRGSDLAFVRKLARRNAFEFFFDADSSGSVTAHFRPPSLHGTPQKDLALLFGDDSNLRSFAARVTTQRPLAVKVAQVDIPSASANVATVSSPQLTRLGANDQQALIGGPLGGLVTPSDNLAEMRVLGPPTADAAELQAIAQAVRDEASWFISATGEINSEAYASVLRAHQTVLVKGVGATCSGTYYVTRVAHRLTADGGWMQQFDARRNASGLTGSETFGGGGGLSLPGL
jgi:phage protein D